MSSLISHGLPKIHIIRINGLESELGGQFCDEPLVGEEIKCFIRLERQTCLKECVPALHPLTEGLDVIPLGLFKDIMSRFGL